MTAAAHCSRCHLVRSGSGPGPVRSAPGVRRPECGLQKEVLHHDLAELPMRCQEVFPTLGVQVPNPGSPGNPGSAGNPGSPGLIGRLVQRMWSIDLKFGISWISGAKGRLQTAKETPSKRLTRTILSGFSMDHLILLGHWMVQVYLPLGLELLGGLVKSAENMSRRGGVYNTW